jgi:hypothetical protein
MPPAAISRLGDGFGAARRVYAGEGEHNVAVFRRKGGNLVVGNRRATSEPFVHRENDAADFALAVIGRQFVTVAPDAGFAEVFLCGFIRGVVCEFGFEMNVDVNRNQFAGVHVFPLLVISRR